MNDELALPRFEDINPAFLFLKPEERQEAIALINDVASYIETERADANECNVRFPNPGQVIKYLSLPPQSREIERAVIAFFKHAGWSDVICYEPFEDEPWRLQLKA